MCGLTAFWWRLCGQRGLLLWIQTRMDPVWKWLNRLAKKIKLEIWTYLGMQEIVIITVLACFGIGAGAGAEFVDMVEFNVCEVVEIECVAFEIDQKIIL